MSTEGYMTLLDELSTLDADPDAKAAFRLLVLGRLEAELTEREERIKLAKHLLGNRVPRQVIRERLQIRFGIGRAQAYRDIERALQTVSSK